METRAAPFVQSGRRSAIVEDDDDGAAVLTQVGPPKMELFIADFATLFEGHQMRIASFAMPWNSRTS